MPGIVVFRRRWSAGSDDLIVPGVFLFTVHLIWIIILTILLILVHFPKDNNNNNNNNQCILLLWGLIIGYLIILVLSLIIELWICIVSMRGSILNTEARHSMQYILYFRLVVMLIEAGWLSAGIVWLIKYYLNCQIDNAKQTVLVMIICNWCVLFLILSLIWCAYDKAGRSWVKMKQYQRSMRESQSKYQYKRSGSTRNWRQRKVIRAYQDSWHQRCRFLFCCLTPSDRNKNSFSDIARLLSDFFRDLDVVPSDVIAGLVLLRKFQKIERKAIIEQRRNDTYEFLSGVPITPNSQFLSLNDPNDLELFQNVIYYANFAVKAYGWPVYVTSSKLAICKLCPNLRCCCCNQQTTNCCCFKQSNRKNVPIIDDNCCHCNYAALQKLLSLGDIEIIYATYHCDVGETPFFLALDYERKKLIISIRGTLSIEDILTDLNAEGETIPLQPPKDDWLGHKGMVQGAQYIYDKLRKQQLIEMGLQYSIERNTNLFDLVIVGHSLGAGIASILGILLKQFYPTLQCYCYSPPGGTLSMPAVQYTKSFTISVVVGKDVVPRIGLNQMETLRADLIHVIKRSVDPKWKTIACSLMCCGCGLEPTSTTELSTIDENDLSEYLRAKQNARCIGLHPSDSNIALTSHQPFYPPGRIIHVVRHFPRRGEQVLKKKDPVYQALWTENTEFDQVLISPVMMIQDHMPDKVLDALNKVVTTMGPKKPQRSSLTLVPTNLPTNNKEELMDETNVITTASTTSPLPQKYYLETSFTSLQSPSSLLAIPSNTSITSSLTNYYSHSTITTKNLPTPPPPLLVLQRQQRQQQQQQQREHQPKLLSSSSSSHNIPLRTTQSLTTSPTSPLVLNQNKFDLIYDDWFGLAPLASPESLSELSSISSRTNSHMNIDVTPKIMRRTPKIIGNLSTCADDIRNIRNFQKSKIFLQSKPFNNSPSSIYTNSNSSNSNLSYQSAVSSSNNDHKSPEKLTILIRKQNEDLNETEEEEELVQNIDDNESSSTNYQSAEDILDNVLISAGCKDYFTTPTRTETTIKPFLETNLDELFDFHTNNSPTTSSSNVINQSSKITTPSTPIQEEFDQDLISNLAIDLNLDENKRAINLTKNVKFNPNVINIIDNNNLKQKSFRNNKKSGEQRWYLFRNRNKKKKLLRNDESDNDEDQFDDQIRTSDRKTSSVCSSGSSISAASASTSASASASTSTIHVLPKTILSTKKRRNSPNKLTIDNTNDDNNSFNNKSEALPLLTNLNLINLNNERTLPPPPPPTLPLPSTSNFVVQRKNLIYPSDLKFITNNNNNNNKSGESSV